MTTRTQEVTERDSEYTLNRTEHDPLPTRQPDADEIATHERAEAYARAIDAEVLADETINRLSALSVVLMSGIDAELGRELGAAVQRARDTRRAIIVAQVEDVAAGTSL